MRNSFGRPAGRTPILTICSLGHLRFVDRRLSCEHLPLPESRVGFGFANGAFSQTSASRRVASVGVLAYKNVNNVGIMIGQTFRIDLLSSSCYPIFGDSNMVNRLTYAILMQ